MEDESVKLRKTVAKLESSIKSPDTQSDKDPSTSLQEVKLPEGCGDALPIQTLEIFEMIEDKVLNDVELQSTLVSFDSFFFGISDAKSDKNLQQCITSMPRKLLSRQVAISFNGQTSRNGKKQFNKTKSYQIIKGEFFCIFKFCIFIILNF